MRMAYGTHPKPAGKLPSVATPGSARQVYTVSQLNRLARRVLETEFPILWVEGEISNLARPASGHLYFSLKDDTAQLRCALFRGSQGGSAAVLRELANGQQVLVRGRLGLYEPRGEFQLIAEHLEPAGEGVLRRRLEELKQKLQAEGLFAKERKRPLPALPRAIGVITSPTGAAIRDILHILRRRFPAVPVVIYPVQVQGGQAKHDLVAALAAAGERNECDVLIVARGGGSLEDLWAFNEEVVARAIAASTIPVVSGVGHEVDFTLADFSADVRAPTPSGAAELVVPDQRDYLRRFENLAQRLVTTVRRLLLVLANSQRMLAGRLERSHPGYLLQQNAQRLDELRANLARALRLLLADRRLRFSGVLGRLRTGVPGMREAATRLAVLSGRLHAISPLRTLERGYAIVQKEDGSVVRSVSDVAVGDELTARVPDGLIRATVA
jgi:exodeoxyribonuclease VII large subunit